MPVITVNWLTTKIFNEVAVVLGEFCFEMAEGSAASEIALRFNDPEIVVYMPNTVFYLAPSKQEALPVDEASLLKKHP